MRYGNKSCRGLVAAIIIGVLTLGGQFCQAQQAMNVPQIRAGEQRVYASFGLQNAVVAGLGYARGVALGASERPLVLSA